MTQTIAKVRINTGTTQRVHSVNYLPTPSDYTVAQANDVRIDNTTNNSSVLTYDSVSQTFKVQNVPRINGGTF